MRDENGQFTSGNAGKPKGAVNRSTSERKAKINQVLQAIEENHLDDDLKKLSPKDRTSLYVNLMEYVVPKLVRTERPPTEAEELLAMSEEERRKEIIRLKQELSHKPDQDF